VPTCVEEYNSYSSYALQPKYLYFYSYDGKILATGVPSGNEYSGKVTLTVNKLLQFPVLTLKIKADWLGVYIPVGKPLITSVSSTEFQTGGVSYITTKVKNVGDALGSFGVYAQCNQPFSFIGTTEFISLNPNEEGIVNLKISGTCSQKTQGSCVVYAYDRNNPNNKDSKTVSVSCTPIVLCNAGETRCNGKVIEQCNQAGSGWNAIQTCDYTCEIKEGKATCVSPPQPKPPEPPEPAPKIPWAYVWAGLAGLLAFLIIGRKDIEEKKWVGITIAGIIAFIIAIIVWWIAENWVMIAISLGLLAILGGVAMWLIPGLFTAILTIFAVIIGTIRR
jgi:hypothetical protein